MINILSNFILVMLFHILFLLQNLMVNQFKSCSDKVMYKDFFSNPIYIINKLLQLCIISKGIIQKLKICIILESSVYLCLELSTSPINHCNYTLFNVIYFITFPRFYKAVRNFSQHSAQRPDSVLAISSENSQS